MPWAFSTHQRFSALVIAGLNREVFCGTTATGKIAVIQLELL